ncbi:MAG TPA: hypothetical protein VE621_09630 [Bryobacteraceae bacterium]|nr:hypothetical protein [Bryobacteraceae bacterium]
MRTRLSTYFSAVWLLLSCPYGLVAQNRLDPRSTMNINLPEDSPLHVVSADWGESTASERGGALLLDLHTTLAFKNNSHQKVRGVTLLVRAQDATPGGKASVTVPSLNVGPGETFPVRIDLRLLRPLAGPPGPTVEVELDGLLFDDLSFYGPNTLNSRRSMLVWEHEARRDRRFFRNVLETGGSEGLRDEMLNSLKRQADRAAMDARVTQSGRATTVTTERELRFAFLDVPGSPVALRDGSAGLNGEEVRRPRMSLANMTTKPLRSMEIGWMVRDSRGRSYLAGSIPVEVPVGPRGKTTVIQDAVFRFAQPGGQPISVESLTGFVSNVEYQDGQVWIPERIAKIPNPSPEEQRLAELYRKRGIQAVIEELRKF